MNIEAKEFKLEMTHDELWSTAHDVKNALEYTLKTHWVNHQNAWEINEQKRIARIQRFFQALGRPDLYEDIPGIAKGIFDAFNKKRQLEKAS